MKTLNNSVRLIGTMITPFTKTSRGKFSVYEAEIEVEAGSTSNQTILLTFYPKSDYKITNYNADLTGKQVAIEGYIQGNKYVNATKTIHYMYVVVRELSVVSSGDDERDVIANGDSIIDDEDLPF